jgi:hypothetical protein
MRASTAVSGSRSPIRGRAADQPPRQVGDVGRDLADQHRDEVEGQAGRRRRSGGSSTTSWPRLGQELRGVLDRAHARGIDVGRQERPCG